jgi:hypothetical protein
MRPAALSPQVVTRLPTEPEPRTTSSPPSPPTTTRSPQPLPAGVFPIEPRFPGEAGSVTVTVGPGGADYHVVITGLVAGSVHAVHVHFGSCANVSRSTHLAILTIGAANGAGRLVFDSILPARDAGRGRILIVYNAAQPFLVIGCASL